MRAHLALAASLLLGTPAAAQTTWLQCAVPAPCKVWHGTATTTGTGAWSVVFASGIYTRPPHVVAQAVSSGPGLSASAQATVSARDTSGASGIVTLPATVTVGGLPVMAAGAGVQVDVVAVGE